MKRRNIHSDRVYGGKQAMWKCLEVYVKHGEFNVNIVTILCRAELYQDK